MEIERIKKYNGNRKKERKKIMEIERKKERKKERMNE